MVPIPEESFRNYHIFWHTYNNNLKNFTLYCHHENYNCSDPKNYKVLTKENSQNVEDFVNTLRKYPERGILLEVTVNQPPCSDKKIIDALKIDPICSFLRLVSNDKGNLLILMKYTKQSPHYLEEETEFMSLFRASRQSFEKYGYLNYTNKVVMI